MKAWDNHFLRYAGAEPPRQMFKEQRLAHAAHESLLASKKPEESAVDLPAALRAMADPGAVAPERDKGWLFQTKV